MAKIHKILPSDNVDKLVTWPAVSNINRSTYHLAKKLLLTLCQSIYHIAKHFRRYIKNAEISNGYEIVSFDVKLLFTLIALGKTIGRTV